MQFNRFPKALLKSETQQSPLLGHLTSLTPRIKTHSLSLSQTIELEKPNIDLRGFLLSQSADNVAYLAGFLFLHRHEIACDFGKLPNVRYIELESRQKETKENTKGTPNKNKLNLA